MMGTNLLWLLLVVGWVELGGLLCVVRYRPLAFAKLLGRRRVGVGGRHDDDCLKFPDSPDSDRYSEEDGYTELKIVVLDCSL